MTSPFNVSIEEHLTLFVCSFVLFSLADVLKNIFCDKRYFFNKKIFLVQKCELQ